MNYLISYGYTEDDSEYSFRYRDNTVKMCYSGSSWTKHIQHKECARFKDTNNGINIKLKGVKKIKLDYSEVEILYILLTYYMKETQTATPTIYKVEKELVD